MTRARPDAQALWEAVAGVPDPEVPALSVVDLGIVRDIRVDAGEVVVDVTPTYSGCPAMHVIETDIVAAIRAAGADHVTVRTVYHPAWTTDWLSESAREALRRSGIAPPAPTSRDADELIPLRRREAPPVPCPWCGSRQTELRSEFGPTACKAIHFCNDCRQPFEHFKPL
ncbi:MAG TPA: 1,2-phenylacetyl-CoA epoxidase subunit PaaD [Gemmatimonadaceae bacterium]|nr:1,2-phenylacetyl-CoA epoxidase subunit PaaD [Gemmatimonadaceae bacterium]